MITKQLSPPSELAVYYTLPTRPRAAIFWVHGHGEHFGRYSELAEVAESRGLAMLGLDLYGHGNSGGKRGVLPARGYRDNVKQALNFLSAMLPEGTPVFACGHSMGANVLTDFLLHHRDHNFSAVLLSAPYFELAFAPPAWKLGLAKVMKSVLPALTQPTGLDTAALCRSESVVAAYCSDRLVHDRMSVAAFHACESNGKAALLRASEIVPELPLTVVHGDADKITSFSASERFVQSRKATRFRALHGYYHEWFREEAGEEILWEEIDYILSHYKRGFL